MPAIPYQGIALDSAPFDLAFRVEARDERWVHNVLHEQARKFLLSQPRFTIQMAGWHVLVYRSREFQAPDLEDAAMVAGGQIGRLPGAVVQECLSEG